MAISRIPGIQAGNDGAADVVPHAEDGTRDGGHRIGGEVECSETGGKTRVLHAHLDADSLTFGSRKAQQATYQIAYRKSAKVVEESQRE